MRERKNSLLTLLSISGFDSRDREEPTGLEGTTGPEGTVGPIVEALPTATPTPTVEATPTEQMLEPTPASLEEIGPTPVRIVVGTVLPGAELHWTEWVRQFAPRATALPMAAYHERIWEWFEELQPGVKPAALVECVFRGGGKSTTVELALARQAVRADRRFALYVSATQQAANRHVQAVAATMERVGIERSVNKYGTGGAYGDGTIFDISATGVISDLMAPTGRGRPLG